VPILKKLAEEPTMAQTAVGAMTAENLSAMLLSSWQGTALRRGCEVAPAKWEHA
jgi:hypothetical protein